MTDLKPGSRWLLPAEFVDFMVAGAEAGPAWFRVNGGQPRPINVYEQDTLIPADRITELEAEVERLNKALTYEENRTGRIGTHGPGCHLWGPAHYECLKSELEKLK